MFTVKAVGIHGEEQVFQCDHVVSGTVSYKGHECNGRRCIEFSRIDSRVLSPIYFGNVFVMNEAGKTIAVYRLGGWEHAEKRASGVDAPLTSVGVE